MDILLEHIISHPRIHQRWLATLSYLELCGARKIAAYLPKTLLNGDFWKDESELMQHTAEEFRHAYFFHKQIEKLGEISSSSSIPKLCKRQGSRYLHLLDLGVARLIREVGSVDVRKGCYILTTYAIEKRAQEIYGLYESLLRKKSVPITLRSVLIEENTHLHQIEEEIAKDPILCGLKDEARTIEHKIFSQFWREIECEISLTLKNELASLQNETEHTFIPMNGPPYDKISPSCG